MGGRTARHTLAACAFLIWLVPALAHAQLTPTTIRGLTQLNASVEAMAFAGKSGAALGQALWSDRTLWRSPDVQTLVVELRNQTVSVNALVEPGSPLEPVLRSLATMPVTELPFVPHPGNLCKNCTDSGPSSARLRCTGEMPPAFRELFESPMLQIERPPQLPAQDLEVISRGLSRDITQIMEEAGPVHEAIIKDAMEAVKRCGSNEACIREGVEQAVEGRRGMLSKFCMGRNPVAMRSLINNYLINFTALGVAVAKSDTDEFPFDYAATIAILGALWGEVGCRAQLEGAGARAGTGAGSGLDPTMFEKYKQYIRAAPVAAATVVGTSLTEDYIRGDIEPWQHYAKEGAMVLVHDLLWANPKMAWVYDPIYLRGMPKARLWMTGQWDRVLVQPLASRGMAQASMLIGRGSWIPGAASELALRWGFRTFDTWVFINLRKSVTEGELGAEIDRFIGTPGSAPPPTKTSDETGMQNRIRIDYMTPKTEEVYPETPVISQPPAEPKESGNG